MEEVMRRNQEMYAPYFECTRKHEKEMQHFQAAREVRELTTMRDKLRVVKPEDPQAEKYRVELAAFQAKLEASVPLAFQRYRALGGTAASPEAVVVPENPCPPPIRLPSK